MKTLQIDRTDPEMDRMDRMDGRRLAPFTRRRFLSSVAGALAGAGLCGRAHAETTVGALQITVERDRWGKASPADISALLLSAAEQIWKHCPRTQLDPIRVYHRADFPMTDTLRDGKGRISIGIASQDTRWSQFSFQFGHEFCHALAQHSGIGKRGWHNLRHANMWLEESLCETGSLFTLRRMAEVWSAKPPFPAWRPYAPALALYASARLALPQHRLPNGVPFPAWFRDNETALRGNPVLRDKNTIIASQLLPLLESEPAGWEALCYLNLGSRDAKKPLAKHLAEWRGNVVPELRGSVEKIGEVFGVAA